jgi:hypothetical protein
MDRLYIHFWSAAPPALRVISAQPFRPITVACLDCSHVSKMRTKALPLPMLDLLAAQRQPQRTCQGWRDQDWQEGRKRPAARNREAKAHLINFAATGLAIIELQLHRC